MKVGFTTLACPNWDLDTILKRSVEYGFDGIDFRGTSEGVDITTQRAFTSDLGKTVQRIGNTGLQVSGVSSSIRVCQAGLFEENLEEAKRTIPVALALGAKQIRVFGYGEEGRERQAWVEQGRKTMEAILSLDGADRLHWVLEMHDYWVGSPDCIQLVEAVDDDAFRVLWDIGHTTRVGTESPEETWAQLGSKVESVHVKDAVYRPGEEHSMKDGWRYVLPGTGELPLAAAVGLLQQSGFDGWYLFEHEKRWHADLEEPEAALPAYVRWIRGLAA